MYQQCKDETEYIAKFSKIMHIRECKYGMVMNIHCKISMGIDKITKQYEHECQQKLVKSYMYIAKNKLLLIFVKLQGVLSET